MSPSNVARTWVRGYFVLEVIWFVFWLSMMLAYKFGTGEDGQDYRIGNEIQALHFALFPLVYFTMEDGSKLVAILYGAVIATDTSRLLEIVLHTSAAARTIDWAWGTSIAVAAYGLFIGMFVLAWLMYVWANDVRFKSKTSKI